MGGNAPPAPTSIALNSSPVLIPALPALWYASIRPVAVRRDPIEGAGLSAWRSYEHMFVLRQAGIKGNFPVSYEDAEKVLATGDDLYCR